MKRRVNLIAGIMHQPKLLFLDEQRLGRCVTRNVVITDYLKQLNAGGMTIIYTSHHLSEAEDFCTDIAIIVDRGQMFAHATPSELIATTPNAPISKMFLLN